MMLKSRAAQQSSATQALDQVTPFHNAFPTCRHLKDRLNKEWSWNRYPADFVSETGDFSTYLLSIWNRASLESSWRFDLIMMVATSTLSWYHAFLLLAYGTPASFTIISCRSWLTRWWMAPRVRNSLVFLHALPSLEYFTEIFKHKHAKKLLGPSNRENKNCSEVLIKNHYNSFLLHILTWELKKCCLEGAL